MDTIRERLACYTPEQAYGNRKTLSVKEKGKKYSVMFSEDRLCAVFQVDGDIIKEGLKCDKLILSENNVGWTEIFVELKGRDIDHAIDQLATTLRKDIFKHPTVRSKHARIVGRSIPRSTGNSILERAKIRFAKSHSCDLRAVCPGTVEKF